MSRNLHIILISILTFSIISCGKDSNSPASAADSAVSGTSSSGSDGTNGKNSLISTTTESAGSNCSTGGLKIQSGLDSDADGVLDSTEVTATTYVCNGGRGKSTILCTGGVGKLLGTQVILDKPEVSISKTIESPTQISGGDGNVYIGISCTETVKQAESEHPVESVATTQYVPGVVTVNKCPVWPVDQR